MKRFRKIIGLFLLLIVLGGCGAVLPAQEDDGASSAISGLSQDGQAGELHLIEDEEADDGGLLLIEDEEPYDEAAPPSGNEKPQDGAALLTEGKELQDNAAPPAEDGNIQDNATLLAENEKSEDSKPQVAEEAPKQEQATKPKEEKQQKSKKNDKNKKKQSSNSTAKPDSAKSSEAADAQKPKEDGIYSSKEDVALYLHTYGKLPKNYITKKEANALGWSGGSLEGYAPGKCIGGSYFGNYEGKLPEKNGRKYYECDIDTLGAKKRGPKRLIYSNDGLIYYTGDHYETFELLYE